MNATLQKTGATLAAGLLLAAPALAQGGIGVTVNRRPVNFTGQGPIQSRGRVLVPLRGVLEKLGAYVTYNSARREVRAVRNQTQIRLPIGGDTAQVDGRPVPLDVPARIVNGSTMVPLRFVAEALGAQVNYEAATSTVAIRTGGGYEGGGYNGGGYEGGGGIRPRPNPPLPAHPGRFDRATIIEVRANQDRLVIQDADGGRRTVNLAPGYEVRRRTADGGSRPITLGRVRPGDVVALEMRGGTVRTVTVLPDRAQDRM